MQTKGLIKVPDLRRRNVWVKSMPLFSIVLRNSEIWVFGQIELIKRDRQKHENMGACYWIEAE
jgi:hypothetical protein